MRISIILLSVLILTVSNLIMVKHEYALAQTATPTIPPITPSQTSISTPSPPATTLNPTSSPTPTPTIPKPIVPEFIVKLITSPTEVNKTIALSIKNQPFTPYYDSSVGWIHLFYDVRAKEHSVENWTNLYLREDLPYLSENVPEKSDSGYTILSYSSLQSNSENTYILGDKMMDFPANSQVDFQVEALAGYIHRVWNPNATNQLEMLPYVFNGQESSWSSTQTITLVDTSTASPTPSPTTIPTPTQTTSLTQSPSSSPTKQPTLEPIQTAIPTAEPKGSTNSLSIIAATIFVIIVVVAGLLFYWKKIKKQK
jgi:hypothetical protein